MIGNKYLKTEARKFPLDMLMWKKASIRNFSGYRYLRNHRENRRARPAVSAERRSHRSDVTAPCAGLVLSRR